MEAEPVMPIKFKFCGANFFKPSGKISAASLTKIFLGSIKFPIKHNLLKEFCQLKKFFGGQNFLQVENFFIFYKKLIFIWEAELIIPIKFEFCDANF